MPPPRADDHEIDPAEVMVRPRALALRLVELPSHARDSPTSPALPDADADTAPPVEADAPTVRPAMLCDRPTETELADPSVLMVALVPSKPEPDQLTPEPLSVTEPKSQARPTLAPLPPVVQSLHQHRVMPVTLGCLSLGTAVRPLLVLPHLVCQSRPPGRSLGHLPLVAA